MLQKTWCHFLDKQPLVLIKIMKTLSTNQCCCFLVNTVFPRPMCLRLGSAWPAVIHIFDLALGFYAGCPSWISKSNPNLGLANKNAPAWPSLEAREGLVVKCLAQRHFDMNEYMRRWESNCQPCDQMTFSGNCTIAIPSLCNLLTCLNDMLFCWTTSCIHTVAWGSVVKPLQVLDRKRFFHVWPQQCVFCILFLFVVSVHFHFT